MYIALQRLETDQSVIALVHLRLDMLSLSQEIMLCIYCKNVILFHYIVFKMMDGWFWMWEKVSSWVNDNKK